MKPLITILILSALLIGTAGSRSNSIGPATPADYLTDTECAELDQSIPIDNDSIQSLKIYYERRGDTTYYSLDFNDKVGYDYLTLNEARRAVKVYPRSIYSN